MTGLIKTAMALERRVIPPTLHFEQPNLKCGFETSPFYVVSKLTEWKGVPLPRRAGVSAFGIGGTNAHVVLEEAPPFEPQQSRRPAQLLLMSAKSEGALDQLTKGLEARLKKLAADKNPGGPPPDSAASKSAALALDGSVELADMAYTLQTGRRVFKHRRALAVHGVAEAITLLGKPDPKRVFTRDERDPDAPGSVPVPRARRSVCEHGPAALRDGAGVPRGGGSMRGPSPADTRARPPPAALPAAGRRGGGARATHPNDHYPAGAVCVIGSALAKLWLAWGVRPAAVDRPQRRRVPPAVLAGVMSSSRMD